MNKRKVGASYESVASSYLEAQGCRVICRNYRCRLGEIDLIAVDETGDKACLVFVEVKYRRQSGSGRPEEAVTPAKQRTIRKVAEHYCMRYKIRSCTPCRFDVIAVEGEQLRHIQNAFW